MQKQKRFVLEKTYFDSRQGRNIGVCSKECRPHSVSTLPANQWVKWGAFLEVKAVEAYG